MPIFVGVQGMVVCRPGGSPEPVTRWSRWYKESGRGGVTVQLNVLLTCFKRSICQVRPISAILLGMTCIPWASLLHRC